MNFNPKPPEMRGNEGKDSSLLEENEEFEGGSSSSTSFPQTAPHFTNTASLRTTTENQLEFIPQLFEVNGNGNGTTAADMIYSNNDSVTAAALASYQQQQQILHQQASASIQMLEQAAAGLANAKQINMGPPPPLSKATPDFVKKLYKYD